MKSKFTVILIAIAFIATSCAGSKSSAEKKEKVDPLLGTWEVVTNDTPEGDVKSTLVIAKNEENAYTGVLTSNMGETPLENFVIEDSKMNSSFEIQGMEFEFKGTFEGNDFNGEVNGMGSSFPSTGSKIEN